jgi:hypothetical protein
MALQGSPFRLPGCCCWRGADPARPYWCDRPRRRRARRSWPTGWSTDCRARTSAGARPSKRWRPPAASWCACVRGSACISRSLLRRSLLPTHQGLHCPRLCTRVNTDWRRPAGGRVCVVRWTLQHVAAPRAGGAEVAARPHRALHPPLRGHQAPGPAHRWGGCGPRGVGSGKAAWACSSRSHRAAKCAALLLLPQTTRDEPSGRLRACPSTRCQLRTAPS